MAAGLEPRDVEPVWTTTSAFVGEVGDEDPHDAEGQGQVRRQLGDRQDRGGVSSRIAGVRGGSAGSARAVDASTSASSGRSVPAGRMRPPVTAYGRTTPVLAASPS